MLAQQAEQLVRRHKGREINLRDPQVVAARERSLVVRCAVTGWDGVASVVLKRNEGDDARGFTDWASLAFLSTLEEATGVAPYFYAGDARERFFVMEDLGGSWSLADVLANADAATVVETLKSLATSMARLIAATSAREGIFERMRATLPGGADLGRRREATRWLEARDRVAQWAAALAIPLPHGFDVACAQIAAVYADPGPYLSSPTGTPRPRTTTSPPAGRAWSTSSTPATATRSTTSRRGTPCARCRKSGWPRWSGHSGTRSGLAPRADCSSTTGGTGRHGQQCARIVRSRWSRGSHPISSHRTVHGHRGGHAAPR